MRVTSVSCVSYLHVFACDLPSMIVVSFFFFQAEDGIRDLVRSRGLGDVYKRQGEEAATVLTMLVVILLGARREVGSGLGLALVEDLSLIHI